MTPKEFLRSLRACCEAIDWVDDKTAAAAWRTCKRGDWMLWLLGKLSGPPGDERRKPLVQAACACARLSLRYVPTGEDRPRKAIETAEAWTRGEATVEQVRAAASAATSAAAAYAAAYYDDAAAAYYAAAAAYAAANAAAAASAAAYAAAAAAATAAHCAADSDSDIAWEKILARCATIVRKHYPKPPRMVMP